MGDWFNAVILWWCQPWNLLSGVMSVIALIGTFMNAERNKWGFAFWLISNMYMVKELGKLSSTRFQEYKNWMLKTLTTAGFNYFEFRIIQIGNQQYYFYSIS